jgi:hypothetical protein
MIPFIVLHFMNKIILNSINVFVLHILLLLRLLLRLLRLRRYVSENYAVLFYCLFSFFDYFVTLEQKYRFIVSKTLFFRLRYY